MIGIIDYGMGNLRSVEKAFQHLGFDAKILIDPSELEDVTHAVLPGVGAFGDAMANLNKRGWADSIRAFVAGGKPFLGICLGMQLLFDSSTEGGKFTQGLSLLPGDVVAFEGEVYGAGKLKVPHMGWNPITWEREDPLLAGLKQNDHVYFVHGYHVLADAGVVTAVADYPTAICGTVWKNNIWATQFHPEKSQGVGLRMLKNFAETKRV